METCFYLDLDRWFQMGTKLLIVFWILKIHVTSKHSVIDNESDQINTTTAQTRREKATKAEVIHVFLVG